MKIENLKKVQRITARLEVLRAAMEPEGILVAIGAKVDGVTHDLTTDNWLQLPMARYYPAIKAFGEALRVQVADEIAGLEAALADL